MAAFMLQWTELNRCDKLYDSQSLNIYSLALYSKFADPSSKPSPLSNLTHFKYMLAIPKSIISTLMSPLFYSTI